jgi:hypothetical protein
VKDNIYLGKRFANPTGISHVTRHKFRLAGEVRRALSTVYLGRKIVEDAYAVPRL